MVVCGRSNTQETVLTITSPEMNSATVDAQPAQTGLIIRHKCLVLFALILILLPKQRAH